MSVSMIINQNISLGGANFLTSTTLNANGEILKSLAGPDILLAAKDGTLSTRTNGTDGTLTMSAGHGIITGDKLDIYWSGGSCRGATVGTVSGNTVPFTGATGTALPIATTVITAMVPTNLDIAFIGNNMQGLITMCDVIGTIAFFNSSNTELFAITGLSYAWWLGNGITNPLAGVTVDHVHVTHGDSSASRNMKIGILYD